MDARPTIRNAAALMAQRLLHIVAAALFALMVPRLMGPAVFGRYALLTSVSMWFSMLSGLGAVSVMTRAVPALVMAGDTAGLRRLMSSLLALRTFTAVAAASLYFAVIVLLLDESDLLAASFIAGGVFCRTVANVCFSFFLGLNQAARWGLGDLLRRWLTLVLVLVGFPVAGLQGACAAFLIANVIVLVFGLARAWDYLHWAHLDMTTAYLGPLIRLGTFFAAGNLLLALVHRSGETLVRLSTSDYVQVGFFGAAYSIYLTGAQALWQLGVAFAPFLVARVQQGDKASAAFWLEQLLKGMTIIASMSALAWVFIGTDIVPLVLGRAYSPVAWNLAPLTVALIAFGLCSVGRLISLVVDRPGDSAVAAGVELFTFWTVGSLLTTRYGSFGATGAALVGTLGYAAYITWRMRRTLPFATRPALIAVSLAAAFLPLAWLRSTWPMNIALLVVSIGAYLALLRLLRVVTAAEISAARELLRSRSAAEAADPAAEVIEGA
jgi:O-antigen/teichoic acid export membrane protein